MTPGMMASHKQGGITYRQPFCLPGRQDPAGHLGDAHAHPGSALLAQQWTLLPVRVWLSGTPIPSVPCLPHRQVSHSRLLAVAGLCPQAVEGMWGSSTSLAPTQPGPTLTAPNPETRLPPRSVLFKARNHRHHGLSSVRSSKITHICV